MNKKTIIILMILSLWFMGPLQVKAGRIDDHLFDSKEGVLILEERSGDRLYEKGADQRYYPASTTKLVTALVVCEEISDFNEKVTVGEEIKNLDPESSVADLEVGETLTYKDLLYGLMLPSGNDAALVLAHHIGQRTNSQNPIEGFVTLMNRKVKNLGLSNTHFENPHGLHHPKHYTTPEDLAIIAQESFTSKTLLKIINTPHYTCSGLNGKQHQWYNSNLHLFADKIPPVYDRKGEYLGKNPFYNPMIWGGKTGFTDEAGRCFVFLSQIRNMEIIGVLLGADDKTGIFVQSNAVTENIDKSYALLDWNNILEKKNQSVLNPRSERDAWLSLQTDEEMLSCLSESEKRRYQLDYKWDDTYCYETEGQLRLNRSIIRGAIVGEGIVQVDNREVKRFPLISSETISKRTWASILKDVFLKVHSVIILDTSPIGIHVFTSRKAVV